jgi:hypothetical protein
MSREMSLDPKPTERCQCCNFKTLLRHGHYQICPVCFWEDEGHDDTHGEWMQGGPNGLSLGQARANFQLFGAVEERFKVHVRLPTQDEI